MASKITTYGLYDATFTRKYCGGDFKQENWWGGKKMPQNKSSGRAVKFKKVGKGY